MSSYSTIMVDPSGNYDSDYSSRPFQTGFGSGIGVIQVDLGESATSIEVQGRMSSDAPWVSLKTYTESGIEQITLPYYVRVVSLGGGKVWIGGAQ